MKEWLIKLMFEWLVRYLPIVKPGEDRDVGVCTLLCHKHVSMFMWNLTAFYYFMGKSLPVYIVDDGSLTKSDKIRIKKYFVATFSQVDKHNIILREKITKYRNISKYLFDPKVVVLKKKVGALILCPFKKFIYIDSDILFINKPDEIVEWLKNDGGKNWYTAHHPYIKSCYGYYDEMGHWAFRRLLFRAQKNIKDATFNSGLLGICDSGQLDLAKINNLIKLFDEVGYLYHFLSEEVLLSYAYGEVKSKLIPTLKYLNVSGEDEYVANITDNVVSVHYSGEIKNFRYKSDLLKLAWRTRLFGVV